MAQQAAFGTLLEIDNAGYSTVAYVRDISGPNLSMDTIETTNHSSSSGWRTYVAGLIDGGEISANIAWDPGAATHGNSTGLLSELTGRTIEGFRVTWPDTSTFTFDGLVTGFEPGAPHDGLLTADVRIKVTGAVTVA